MPKPLMPITQKDVQKCVGSESAVGEKYEKFSVGKYFLLGVWGRLFSISPHGGKDLWWFIKPARGVLCYGAQKATKFSGMFRCQEGGRSKIRKFYCL